MHYLRRWNHSTHAADTYTSSQATSSPSSTIIVPQQQQQELQPHQRRPSSQIPLQLEVAMKKMNAIQNDYDQDNIHAQPYDDHLYSTNRAASLLDEITMDSCTACRCCRRGSSSSSSKCMNHKCVTSTLISESTIQYCYYSITSLFRNHKKVVLHDGLTKCHRFLAREEQPSIPTNVSYPLLHPTEMKPEDIHPTRSSTGTSSTDVPTQRQIVNDFDRTTVNDTGSKNNTKMVYHIDTTIVQQRELQPSDKTMKKSQGIEEEEIDQMTALETPSPVHTDDESDMEEEDNESVHQQQRNPKETRNVKFFCRGKLV